MTRPMPALWTFQAKLVKVVDGDTVDMVLDVGFRRTGEERLRLLGVNTPETKGATREAGLASKTYVQSWLLQGIALNEWPFRVQTAQDDAFGRYLAIIWRVMDGACLNDDLLSNGHAVSFMDDAHGILHLN